MKIITDNYQLLIRKLDEFIRKFYVNQLIRGTIYTGAILLASFLIINVLEYFFYFSSGIRTILFFGFLAGALFVLVRWVAIPLLHYFKLGKIISQEKAASIIGSHFSEVQDRLLNILQLKKQMNGDDFSLIEASINQKIIALKPIAFSSAINLSVNRKYLRYLILPVLALAFILFSSPNIIKDSTLRLLHHNEYFEKKAPFQFTVLNSKLQTVQYQDYEVRIRVSGEALPGEANIEINGFQYPLSKKSVTEYTYNFVKPQKDIPFYIAANGFRSKDYSLKVLPKPIIVKFSSALTYPAYIGKRNETLQNIGDLTVPEGTKINWHFLSQNTSDVSIKFGDSTYATMKSGGDVYEFTRRVKNDVPYTVFVSGDQLPKADSIRYSIVVVPDRYPAVSVSQVSDSTNKKYLYFAGEASDDYGLKNLFFKYRIVQEGLGEESKNEKYETVPVQFSAGKFTQFSHYWDLNSLGVNPGDQITYFFEIWDNDGVNGSKFTRSQVMTFAKPTDAEMEKQTDQENEKIKNDLESSVKEAEQLKNEYEKLQNDLLNKKNPSWEDKKKIEDLLQRQQKLNKMIEDTKKSFSQNIDNQKDYKQFDEKTREKAEELQKLMDETLTPEMKEMMERLQELLDELNKDKALDQLQDQKLNNEQLQKELDRMLSLFKQLEFEKKMNDTKEKLDKLSEKQNELSNKTNESDKGDKKDKEATQDSLSKEQSKLQEEFKDVEKELDKLDSLNKDLDHPEQLPDMQQEQEQTEQEQENAQQNLQKNNNKKASENQKNAAKKMQEMSKKMDDAMQSMEQQQDEMDMQATRQILENLIKISFDQEDLINKTKGVNIYNPQYLDIMKSQKDIQDDLQMVEDSIQELSKKVYQIKSFVNEQIGDINKHMEQGLSALEQRQPGTAASNQQYIMTAVNNLALMFNEVLQQLQQQMSQQMSGDQMCQKPGGKKPKPSSLGQMQKQLNDKIQQLGQQMKDGKMPMDKQGGQQMSQQLAQMAQQQAQIREALRKMNEELNKDGKNSLGNLDQLQKNMEKTETELLNKQMTAEMMKRQQEILTRLLEAENAERQRETDNKRESNSGKDMVKKLPPEIEEYLKKKEAELELYKTVPPDLKPFYRNLVEEYYKSLRQ